jgi:plasmid stabilization system protein ParE
MQTYKVDVLPIAREDISEIYYYIASDNPSAAIRMAGEIIDKIDTLADLPKRCSFVPDVTLARQGYRMLIIGNYIAFFKVFETEVLVYRALHGMRNYPQLLAHDAKDIIN